MLFLSTMSLDTFVVLGRTGRTLGQVFSVHAAYVDALESARTLSVEHHEELLVLRRFGDRIGSEAMAVVREGDIEPFRAAA